MPSKVFMLDSSTKDVTVHHIHCKDSSTKDVTVHHIHCKLVAYNKDKRNICSVGRGEQSHN